MGIGVGIVLIAIGAILAFAVSPHIITGGHSGGAVDLTTVGWILIVVGALGLLLSLTVWSSWAGPGYFSRRRSDTYVDRPGRVSRHETIDEM
jgi:hypothetical protein